MNSYLSEESWYIWNESAGFLIIHWAATQESRVFSSEHCNLSLQKYFELSFLSELFLERNQLQLKVPDRFPTQSLLHSLPRSTNIHVSQCWKAVSDWVTVSSIAPHWRDHLRGCSLCWSLVILLLWLLAGWWLPAVCNSTQLSLCSLTFFYLTQTVIKHGSVCSTPPSSHWTAQTWFTVLMKAQKGGLFWIFSVRERRACLSVFLLQFLLSISPVHISTVQQILELCSRHGRFSLSAIDRVSLDYISLITPTMPLCDDNTRQISTEVHYMISETSNIMYEAVFVMCVMAPMSRESSHDHVGVVPGGHLCCRADQAAGTMVSSHDQLAGPGASPAPLLSNICTPCQYNTLQSLFPLSMFYCVLPT